MGQNGRLVIPAEFRRALGLGPGGEVVLRLEDGGLRLYTAAQAVARSRALVRRYVPEEVAGGLSGSLVSDRRAEAARE